MTNSGKDIDSSKIHTGEKYIRLWYMEAVVLVLNDKGISTLGKYIAAWEEYSPLHNTSNLSFI